MPDDSDAPSVLRDTLRLTVGLDAVDLGAIHRHGTLWFDGVSGTVLQQLIALGVTANDATSTLPPVAEFVEFLGEYDGFRAFGWITNIRVGKSRPHVYVTGFEMAATDSLAPKAVMQGQVDHARYHALKEAVWTRFSDATRIELTPELIHVDYCFSPPQGVAHDA